MNSMVLYLMQSSRSLLASDRSHRGRRFDRTFHIYTLLMYSNIRSI